MPEAKLHDATELDYQAFSKLQKQSFAQLLSEAKASDEFMSSEFYRWKYSPPAKAARIAVVYEGNEMIAANAMIPCEISLGGQKILGWQSCDTATLPQARGKGCFIKCLKTLQSSIGENEVFFGFPNKNSMHGFYKVGWEPITNVSTWINPLNFLIKRESSKISEINEFDNRQSIFAETVSSKEEAIVCRSSEYLNWRYTNHPKYNYTLLCYTENDQYSGYAVVRKANVMGRDFCLVMEKLGKTPLIERQMLRHINHWAVKQNLWHSLMMDTCIGRWDAVLSGYIPVPQLISPKKQVLMAESMGGEAANRVCSSSWRVQLGDWDAF